ncbi:hypothetical protein Tco_0623151, partial [Tanacetum coccineum]
MLHSIHSDDGNPTSANIKQALRQEILPNLNLPDHRLVLTEPKINIKMEMEIPGFRRVKFKAACSY